LSTSHDSPSSRALRPHKFSDPDIVEVSQYAEVQRAIMPVVSYRDRTITPLATCFSISEHLPIIVTAAHVIRDFIEANADALVAGVSHIYVLYEAGQMVPGDDVDLGGPIPVHQVLVRPNTDLAVLVLGEVLDGDRVMFHGSINPIGFDVPVAGEHCYGFGYPAMTAGSLSARGDQHVVDFNRSFSETGGRVIEVFADGHDGHTKVPGPSMDCNFPMPSGLSGGPVLTDSAGICGVMSSSIEPFDEGDRWASFVTLLNPLLDFTMDLVENGGTGVERKVSVRELISHGYIDTTGSLPPQSDSAVDDTDSIRCGFPKI
jgi:Trypsin-like peptidase domain